MRGIILDFYGVIFDPNTRQPMQGVREFLELAEQNHISCAVASSSDTKSIQQFLDEHNLDSYIQTVIGGDKVSALKPDPECYMLAAENLGVQPADCVVIDDTLAPLENAKSLGFETIHFYHTQADFSAIIKTIAKLLKLQ